MQINCTFDGIKLLVHRTDVPYAARDFMRANNLQKGDVVVVTTDRHDGARHFETMIIPLPRGRLVVPRYLVD